MGAAVRFTVADAASGDGGAAASLAALPLSLLLPIDGVLRGVAEALLGARNALQPEARAADTRQFKHAATAGTAMSGASERRRGGGGIHGFLAGDSDDADGDEA